MVGTGAKTFFLGLDATDLYLAQRFAADGSMPTLARLLQSGAVVETVAPVGFFVGANWPTIYTGTTASRHRFTCSGQVPGGTYSSRWAGPIDHPPPVWKRLSDAGRRVAALDAPHARVARELNGVQLVEWGCHDRHAGTKSFPATFVDDIAARYGPHPIGTRPQPELAHFAPCDYVHRAGAHRSAAENAALLATLEEGIANKRAVSLDLLRAGAWDLFFTVFGEAHCAGHQLWYLHDESHPWHDAGMRAALGVDPLRAVYASLDATLGDHLALLDDDATAYVLLSHGMRAHYDGTFVLDPVLWRLDQYASGGLDRGWMSRAADTVSARLPRRVRTAAFGAATGVRRRLEARVPFGYFDVEIPWLGQRRWWAQMNDTVSGSVRVNLDGREPNGRIAAHAYRNVLSWLAERLLELVNVDTGAPAVADVMLTDDNYERVPGDPFGDLIVEWNREAPIETVWSPATGIVRVPYDQWRTGDHHRAGLLLATGPGITPGRRAERMPVLDIAPTIAASLGHDFPDFDGTPRADLVPGGRVASKSSVRPARPLPDAQSVRVLERRGWSSRYDVPASEWTDRYAIGVAGAHHHTRVAVEEAQAAVAALEARVHALELAASVATVGAWLRHVDVPEKLLMTVVLTTYNRCELLARAIASVQAQTYPRWELLVVDDGSDDDTASLLEQVSAADPRVGSIRLSHGGRVSRLRNHALAAAAGDVVVYLDDDNVFDPDWLRAVAWTFTERPDANVAYGARVVDDGLRHWHGETGGMPAMELLPWDRATCEQRNLVDANVIAHRRGFADARFDEHLSHYEDWDFVLQLTADEDPVVVPIVATCFMTDAPARLSHSFGTPDVDAQLEYVRRKVATRRAP
jgi:predicted AlkP superfamily phosphohydrolase/phosphomutase